MSTPAHETPAHDQKVTHSYVVKYPAHEPRESDVHYKDFHHYREATKAGALCAIGEHRGDYSECYPPKEHWPTGLQLHHSHIEFAVQNAIDLAWLEKDYPGVSDPDLVGAWVESGANLLWLCERHHIGDDGVHVLTSSDYEAERYVRGLISREDS
jgi:hypothetical protein